MRLVLYVGKGGVGKTTISAASAVQTARAGQRTLVVSTDTAHSLADSLDMRLASTPTLVEPNLWAQEINVLDEVRNNWGKLESYFSTMLKKKGADDVVAEEMALLPGMDELISLLEIWKHVQSGNYDVVFIDAAPTGETVRLLSMPEMFQWYAERIGEWHAGVMRIAKPFIKPFMPKNNVFDVIPVMAKQVAEMHKVLTDPAICSYRVVMYPEKMVVKEAQRAVTYLNLFDYPVDAVVCNRVLPATSPDPFFAAQCEQQQQYLDLIHRTFAPLPIWEVPQQPHEVVGTARLGALAEQLFVGRQASDVFHHGHIQQITHVNNEYVLTLPLPHVELNKVTMTKKGDELIVEIGNFKRDMVLPHTLANREARGARMSDGALHVYFGDAVTQN